METIMEFLVVPLSDGSVIMDRFAALPGAIYHRGPEKLQRFVYVPGSRRDRIVLIAHVDTVWDEAYGHSPSAATLRYDPATRRISSSEPAVGIGADDRAGCAMLWMLRNSGHSLLLPDGEVRGHHGALYLRREHPGILWELNRHQYMIQLDLWGSRCCMYHGIPNSKRFCQYMESALSLQVLHRSNGTDVGYLARWVCGINLSVGYERFHRPEEFLDLQVWEDMHQALAAFLTQPQPRFRTLLHLRIARKLKWLCRCIFKYPG